MVGGDELVVMGKSCDSMVFDVFLIYRLLVVNEFVGGVFGLCYLYCDVMDFNVSGVILLEVMIVVRVVVNC